MGILPIILRDIAWPEGRVVLIPSQVPSFVEVFVRPIGLEPMTRGSVSSQWTERWVSLFVLLVAYAALALIETYSKRSALGCAAS
jgi:hypothetical protein